MIEVEANTAYNKPVFIVGMPRSGTTLLHGILCNTGIFFPIPETHFFSRVAYGLPQNNLKRKHKIRIQRILKRKSRVSVDDGFIDKLNSKKEIFEYVIAMYNPDKKNTFLEKTPRHVFCYSEIMACYPDTKFICLIREPKNVASSQLTRTSKEKKSIVRLSLLYNKIATAIIKIRGNSNVWVVRYEDLTDKPERTLKDVCKFLNIPYDSKLVINVAAPPEIVSEHEFWKHKNIRTEIIQKNNPQKWQKFLNEGQANVSNFITKHCASQFGYDFDYKRYKLGGGIMRDLVNLIFSRELKKVFSRING